MSHIVIKVRDHVVIGIIGMLIGGGLGAGLTVYFWSTEVWPIMGGCVGGAVLFAVILVGLKYCVSALENRKFLRG